MIGYTTVGSNQMEKAVAFYDAIFNILGASKIYDHERFVGWSQGEGQPFFAVVKPYDDNEATFGNGTLIGLPVADSEVVKAVYARAMELGAVCEGPPGPRQGSYYCGYFRDLDGNKLNAYCEI